MKALKKIDTNAPDRTEENKTKTQLLKQCRQSERDLFSHRHRGFPSIFNLMFRWRIQKLPRNRSHYRIFGLAVARNISLNFNNMKCYCVDVQCSHTHTHTSTHNLDHGHQHTAYAIHTHRETEQHI